MTQNQTAKILTPGKPNQAVKILAPGKAAVVDVPFPELPADDYILVKVTAVGVNPTDWKHIDWADVAPCVGSWVGCDYVGVVEAVGPQAKKGFKKGDRICGPVNGSNGCRETDGAFANYIHVRSDVQIHTPDNITDEEAATLGIAITTVGQGLYLNLGLPLPTKPADKPFTILIYGGSSAMGVSGIQYAKLSGAHIITTASPHNFDYVKSLGADVVLDYNDPTSPAKIRELTNSSLQLAWDCLSTEQSAVFVAQCMDPVNGGRVGTLIPVPEDKVAEVNPHVKTIESLFYNAFGEEFMHFGPKQPVLDDHEFCKAFWEMSAGLYAQGKVKPIRVIKNRGGKGLEGVLVGLDELRQGKVSAGKLVYTL